MPEQNIDLTMLGKLVQDLARTVRKIEAETAYRFDRLDNSIAAIDGRMMEMAVELREVKHHLEMD